MVTPIWSVPTIGLILAASKGESEARYALEGLSNQVLAAEYRTILPDEAVLTAALEQTQQALAERTTPGLMSTHSTTSEDPEGQ